MSATSLMMEMPKELRGELKEYHIPAHAFTDEKCRTLKPEWSFILPQGMKAMIRSRRERMALAFKTMDFSKRVDLLTDIEVLSLYVEKCAEEGVK